MLLLVIVNELAIFGYKMSPEKKNERLLRDMKLKCLFFHVGGFLNTIVFLSGIKTLALTGRMSPLMLLHAVFAIYLAYILGKLQIAVSDYLKEFDD